MSVSKVVCSIQDWFHSHKESRRPEFRPYVPQTKVTAWYKGFERQGSEDTMWTMWYLYYMYVEQLYVVHSNLVAYTAKSDTCLSFNRREAGLHYGGRGIADGSRRLLKYWKQEFSKFPKLITKVNFDGSFVESGTY